MGAVIFYASSKWVSLIEDSYELPPLVVSFSSFSLRKSPSSTKEPMFAGIVETNNLVGCCDSYRSICCWTSFSNSRISVHAYCLFLILTTGSFSIMQAPAAVLSDLRLWINRFLASASDCNKVVELCTYWLILAIWRFKLRNDESWNDSLLPSGLEAIED